MKKLAVFALLAPLAALPAQAGLVQVEIRGTVEYNQVRPPASFNNTVVHAGDAVRVTFEVDSENYLNSSSFPTRGYVIIPDSYSLEFDTTTGPVTTGMPSPYPSGGTPYLVLRDNDPHVDGFFLSSNSVDYPFEGIDVDQPARFAPYFQQSFEATYPEDRLPSLDIYDAVGTYDYTGLSVFDFAMVDGGFEAMFIDYQDMTISRVPVDVPVDVKPGGCPNPINVKSMGVLPVAILGTQTLDVANIDPASIRLNGVPPLRSSQEDVGSPFEPYTGKSDCSMDCNAYGPDGLKDLTLKFDTQQVLSTVGKLGKGGCVVLHLTGNFLPSFDAGGPIAGEDVVLIQSGGNHLDVPPVGPTDRLSPATMPVSHRMVPLK